MQTKVYRRGFRYEETPFRRILLQLGQGCKFARQHRHIGLQRRDATDRRGLGNKHAEAHQLSFMGAAGLLGGCQHTAANGWRAPRTARQITRDLQALQAGTLSGVIAGGLRTSIKNNLDSIAAAYSSD